ncbi:hypothetical protein ACQP08_03195 [Micromonospora zamorensis]|uniref:hypothetical protein n=1 Tax=Micromonospora zamorensis TaxID=709883 RepID=UPI003D8B266D
MNLKAATERALAGTSAELHQFLRTGQHTARSAIDPSSLSRQCVSVFTDFAKALMDKEKCATPTNVPSTGCAMLGDLKHLIGENADVLMDMLQFTLMACGLVPGAGEACDIIDAGISFGRGDWVGGLLSGFSAVPFVGAAGTAGKAWKNSDKFRNIKNLIDKLRKNSSCAVPVPKTVTSGARPLGGGEGPTGNEQPAAPEGALTTPAWNLSHTGVPTYDVATGSASVLVANEAGDDYNQAMNKALAWLEERGFKAERVTLGKFYDIEGKPVGMQTADRKTGFRIEFDERSGAHINVWSGKEKGPHYLFNATKETVTNLQGRFGCK